MTTIAKHLQNLLLLALAAMLIITGVACKRSTDFTPKPNQGYTHKSGGSPPSFTTENEVDQHLKWIARGLAHFPKPHGTVRLIDSITNITTNDSNENPIGYLNTLYSFGSPLDDSINTCFLSNNYDSDGLAGFEYNGEDYYTRIYIPNQTYTNGTKPFVVIADEIDKDSIPKDTVVAYKAKPGGGIDSILITEDNSDDYYIWVVNFYNLKDFDQWEAKQGDSLIRKSGRIEYCDSNGSCDFKEKYNPNCPDCTHGPFKYKLEITKMEIFRDNCPKAEKWLNRGYEYAVTYGLYDGTGTPTHVGQVNHFYYNTTIKELKRKDVCRERCIWGGSRGNNCPSHIHNVNYVLYEQIDPSDTSCQMPFMFFELDNAGKIKEYPSSRYELEGKYQVWGFHPYYHSWNAAFVAQTVDVNDMWQANNHNGDTIVIGNNEAKITIELIKLP